MGVTFYARWAALGLFTAFWTITCVLIFDADVVIGVAGMTVGALITAMLILGPAQPRKNYPSTVRSSRKS